MNQLFVKQEINDRVSREQFIEDVELLFKLLKENYGMYEYYGDDAFMRARENVLADLSMNEFDWKAGVASLQRYLYAFIRDGHFTIGPKEQKAEENAFPVYHYAVRYSTFCGIDVIECKKFWYDTEEEREELEQFAASGERYRGDAPLIIDLRDNNGGSDTYMWEFLNGLFQVEPSAPAKFVQKNSELFKEYVLMELPEMEFGPELEVEEEDGVPIISNKPIYVLINEETCSAGESSVAFLKTISSTVLVGTHTGGMFVCGNCMQIYLPNSHVPAYFGTGMWLYEKTRNMDAEGGFKADISYEEFVKKVSSV